MEPASQVRTIELFGNVGRCDILNSNTRNKLVQRVV